MKLGFRLSGKLIVTVQIMIEPSVSVDRNRRCYNQFATDPDPKIHRNINLNSRSSRESSKLYKSSNVLRIGSIAAKIQPKLYMRKFWQYNMNRITREFSLLSEDRELGIEIATSGGLVAHEIVLALFT